MNYKERAIQELRTVRDLEKSICLGEKRIKDINALCGGKAYTIGSGVQTTNNNGTEDFVIALISEKEKTEQRITVNKLKLSAIKAVLSEMTKEENIVLKIVYMEDKRYKMERLARELYCAKDKAYKIRNAALKKIYTFTIR